MKQWTKNDRIKKFLKQIDAMYMYHDFKTRQVFRYFGYPSQPLCNGTSFENSMGVVVQGQVKNLKVQVWKKYVLLTAKNQNPAYFHFFRIIVLDGSIHI